MGTLSTMRDLFIPPDPELDPEFRREKAWLRTYHSADRRRVDPVLVLKHARARYAESLETSRIIGDAADNLLRTAIAVATILVALIGACELRPVWPIGLSLVLLLLAIVVLVVARRPFRSPLLPSIRDVIDGLETAGDHPGRHAWLAASMHGAIIEAKVLNRWKARRLGAAHWLIVAAVGCLLLAVLLGLG